MAINYQIVQAGGTSTDINVSVEGLNLILDLSYYRSGLHSISRTEGSTREIVELEGKYETEAKVTVYLIDDLQVTKNKGIDIISNEGTFVVDVCRKGIDEMYIPQNLVMQVCEFTIPAIGVSSLDELNISAIKVVKGSVVSG